MKKLRFSKRKTLTAILAIFVFALVQLVSVKPVSAADNSELFKKWEFTLYYDCLAYGSNIMTTPVDPMNYGESKKMVDSLVAKKGSEKVPSYNMAGIGSAINCHDVARGKGSFKGAWGYGLPGGASVTWKSPSNAETIMLDYLKYTSTSGSSKGNNGYFTIVAKANSVKTYWSGTTDEKEEDESSVKISVSPCSDDASKTCYKKDTSFGSGWFKNILVELKDGKLRLYMDKGGLLSSETVGDDYKEELFDLTPNMNDLFSEIDTRMTNKTWTVKQSHDSGNNGWTKVTTYHFRSGEIVDSSSSKGYKWESKNAVASIGKLGGFTSLSSMFLSKTEFYNLYSFYLNAAIPQSADNRMTCNPSSEGNLTKVKLVEGGELKDCYVNLNGIDAAAIKVTTQATTDSGSHKAPYITEITLKDVIDYLNGLKESDLDMDQIDGIDSSGDEDEEAENKPSCTTNAHELGWILCPIVTGVSSFLEEFYENWIEPFLNIDIGLFRFAGDDASVEDDQAEYANGNIYQVWAAFQGMANLLFVVLFLVVIFSQLTGVGIDNYGIKKILPKLIVCAVLINLSYLICMIAVELSNVIGYALKGFLNEGPFVPDISNISIKVNQNTPSGEALPTFGTRLAVVGIIAGMAIPYALSVGWAVLIPALILALSVLLSLFFLFAMLGIRQALVVILVCVSPLAFVCYMLPNTKKLFDKWFSIFKAMLVAFPVCSALVYGGNLVAKILIVANQSSSNVISSLGILFTAGIVSIAPVFMIPGLIRKGIEATGALGARLTGLQNRARGSMDKGVRNTSMARDLQARQNSINQFRENRRIRRKAGINEDGTLNERGERLNRKAQRKGGRYQGRLAELRQQAYGSVSGQMSADRITTAGGAAAAAAALTAKQRKSEVDDEITNMAVDTDNYNVDTMEGELGNLMSLDTLTSEQEVRMKALMTKLSASGGDGNKRLINMMSGQGKDSSGNKVNVSQAARKAFTDYATSSEVAGSMGGKDAYMAQYLRDVQSGAGGTTAETSFDEWLSSDSAGRQIDGQSVTNAEFVAKKVLDDDEMLMKQSTASLKRTAAIDEGKIIGGDGKTDVKTTTVTVGAAGAEALGKDRAERILDNDNINKKQEQINELNARAGRTSDGGSDSAPGPNPNHNSNPNPYRNHNPEPHRHHNHDSGPNPNSDSGNNHSGGDSGHNSGGDD